MFIQKVSRTVQRFGMIQPGDRVLVAISGGPDSVAMTQALLELRQRGPIGPFGMVLAHLNHRLRADSGEDEAFCAGLAKRLGLAFASEQADVSSDARRTGRSVEEAGRLARYQFLEKTAVRLGCARIAVGHTRNDQAETFVLRLLRGAGTTGLAAIHPVVGGVLIRPLLEVRREDVLDYLTAQRLPYRLDRSNEDCSIPRNRVRHQVLPFLEKQFNPSLIETLARTADLLREEDEWMEREASLAFEGMAHFEDKDNALWVSVGRLVSLHPALARRVIRRAIRTVRGDLRALSARHVEEVLRLTAPGKSGRQLALPGVASGRSFDVLWFRDLLRHRNRVPGRDGDKKRRLQSKSEAQHGYNGYEYMLPVPGRLEIPEAGGIIQAEESREVKLPAAAGATAVVPLPETGDGDTALRVRSPRPGDRFRALGAPGTKSLSRYLMEHRVERHRRRQIPLVVRGERDVLWVVGHGVSELSRIDPGAGRMLHLSWVEG